MVVKYCNNCDKIINNISEKKCPQCGRSLSNKIIHGGYDLPDETTDYFEDDDAYFPKRESESLTKTKRSKTRSNGFLSFFQNLAIGKETVVRGKVTQYSSSGKEDGKYHRSIFQKVYEALIYKQRCDDILHRFLVVSGGGDGLFDDTPVSSVQVNVHGTISRGSYIYNDSEVEVYGKKNRDGILMARKIISKSGNTQIRFQHSFKATLYCILAVFAVLFLIYIGASTGGGFFRNIGSFLKLWLGTAIVVTILYVVALFTRIGYLLGLARVASGKKGRFPVLGILLVSFVISLLIFNGSGIGGIFSGLLSSLISGIVLVIVLIIVFKLFKGMF